MRLEERIDAFGKLGELINGLTLSERKALAEKARNENPWFTESNVFLALKGLSELLRKDKLTSWASSYTHEPSTLRKVGMAMAGNIPCVGFHDFMCVLLSGHQLLAKPSSQDSVMIRFVAQKLVELEPRFRERISFVDRLNDSEAVIATGSDNTARYFEYYFRRIPHILRKNRVSCAVLQGDEPAVELSALGQDVFSYFGLGCRNVSKLFIPEEFLVSKLTEPWKPFEEIIHHHKYANNYDYQKTIMQMNLEKFHDTGFILLKESPALVSPVALVFFERYKSMQDLKSRLEQSKDKLQVIVSARGWFPGSVPFGKAQLPAVNDYGDGVDTMSFLVGLSS